MKKLLPLTLFIIVLFYAIACKRSEKESTDQKLVTKMDSLSYVLGTDIGKTYRDQGLDINPDAMFRGIREALGGFDTLFTDSHKQQIIDNYNVELAIARERQLKKLIEDNKRKGEAFLRDNGKKDGVVVLPSGLQYYVFREGSGVNPKNTDSVSIHYRLSYIDNTIIEETYNKQPEDINIKNLNNGLAEGITLMKPGAIYDFFMPSYLAFGDTTQYDTDGNVLIPGGSTLIYHVELLKIHKWWYRRFEPSTYYSQPAVGENE